MINTAKEQKEYISFIKEKIKSIIFPFAESEERWRNDPVIVKAVFDMHSLALKFATPEIQDNEDVVIHCINKYGSMLEYASDRIKDNKEIVLQALAKDGKALEYASERLKNDDETVNFALSKNVQVFKYVSLKHKSNRELVKEVIKKDGLLLKDAAPNLFQDIELINIAVESNGWLLEYLPLSIRSNKQIVMKAIKSKNAAFSHVSQDLKYDEEVIKLAIEKDAFNLVYCSNYIKKKKDIVLFAIKNRPHIFKYISVTLQHDKEVILTALNITNKIIEDIPKMFYSDPEIAIFSTENTYSLIAEELKNNKSFIIKMLEKNHNLYSLIKPEFLIDSEIIDLVITKSPYEMKNVPTSIKNYNKYALKLLNSLYPNFEEYESYDKIFPQEIIEKIGDKRPIDYFTKIIFKEDLEKKLKNNNINKIKSKV